MYCQSLDINEGCWCNLSCSEASDISGPTNVCRIRLVRCNIIEVVRTWETMEKFSCRSIESAFSEISRRWICWSILFSALLEELIDGNRIRNDSIGLAAVDEKEKSRDMLVGKGNVEVPQLLPVSHYKSGEI